MDQAVLDDDTAQARDIMLDFAERTGLTSALPTRRYLWTDAFALCNFLALYQATRQARFRDLALELIKQVHVTLGRHRPDDTRKGWISGLSEAEGQRHPTIGGLRIGKPLPERPKGAPVDAEAEWDSDGQYYHYLTKWMHALAQAGIILGQDRFIIWAIELARTANRAFIYDPGPIMLRRMHWKMRIDLSEPLVASMGQHDPIDGFVTSLELARAAARIDKPTGLEQLSEDTHTLAAITATQELGTNDALGLGGLLFDAGRLMQIARISDNHLIELAAQLLDAAMEGSEHYLHQGALNAPPQDRLAFREIGLAIGLMLPEALQGQDFPAATALESRLQTLESYRPVSNHILKTWGAQENQLLPGWRAHQDINSVMLATALAPAGFLRLAAPATTG